MPTGVCSGAPPGMHIGLNPSGIHSLFPDSNDLPSCGSASAPRLPSLFPRGCFKSHYFAASSENTVFPGLATAPAGDRATGLAEAWFPSSAGGAWGLECTDLPAWGPRAQVPPFSRVPTPGAP